MRWPSPSRYEDSADGSTDRCWATMVMVVSQTACLVLEVCFPCCLRVAPPSVRTGPHQLVVEELLEQLQQVAPQVQAVLSCP